MFSVRVYVHDDRVRIWLHMQKVFPEIAWCKYYIIQLDATPAKKKIYYSWHIVLSQDIILEYSGRIWTY